MSLDLVVKLKEMFDVSVDDLLFKDLSKASCEIEVSSKEFKEPGVSYTKNPHTTANKSFE